MPAQAALYPQKEQKIIAQQRLNLKLNDISEHPSPCDATGTDTSQSMLISARSTKAQ